MPSWQDLFEQPWPPRYDLSFDADDPPPVSIVHPLLGRLREVDAEAARTIPSGYDPGLGRVGLLFYGEPKWGGYWCSPVNGVAFATTGGDGVHFSLIAEPGPGGAPRVTERSPVVMTCPSDGAPSNVAVGDDLRDFLRFGLTRGYFGMQTLQLYPAEGLRAYGDPAWDVTDERLLWNGLGTPSGVERATLDLLAARLDLVPRIYDADQFAALQRRHVPACVFGPRAAELWTD